MINAIVFMFELLLGFITSMLFGAGRVLLLVIAGGGASVFFGLEAVDTVSTLINSRPI
jgi:hypothetical protein